MRAHTPVEKRARLEAVNTLLEVDARREEMRVRVMSDRERKRIHEGLLGMELRAKRTLTETNRGTPFDSIALAYLRGKFMRWIGALEVARTDEDRIDFRRQAWRCWEAYHAERAKLLARHKLVQQVRAA